MRQVLESLLLQENDRAATLGMIRAEAKQLLQGKLGMDQLLLTKGLWRKGEYKVHHAHVHAQTLNFQCIPPDYLCSLHCGLYGFVFHIIRFIHRMAT